MWYLELLIDGHQRSDFAFDGRFVDEQHADFSQILWRAVGGVVHLEYKLATSWNAPRAAQRQNMLALAST